jgi:sacsin
LTGAYFVALSPHCTFKTRPDNGLRIDFVLEAPKYADSFAAFEILADNPREPFPGTIIRIPLRTEEQAKTSKIINLVITPEDVLKEFTAFQSEVAESLLFLKNIEKVEFEFDDRILGVAEITNVRESLSARTAIKTAITDGTTKSLAFQVHIRHQYRHEEGSIDLHQQYHVQHKLPDINEDNTASNDFKQWAMKESFFPWIALAAPLNPLPVIQSRIFVSLPLPIFMKDNRVNIHGMFALSRDRRSLWTMMDAQSGGKITNEIHWNAYLFKKVIPVVWREMLIELAKLGRPVYDYFPIITPQALALDETLAEDVFEAVVREGSPIWYTTTNAMVPLSAGFVSLEEPSTKLLAALSLFSIPIINKIPKRLIQLIRNSRNIRYTTFMPAAIRECLRDKFKEQPEIKIPIPTAVELLKYIISDNIYSSYIHEIPLFPCKDGNLYSLRRKIFVNHDRIYISTPEEFKLFGGNGSRFLDLSVFDRETIQRLQRDIQDDSWPLNLCRFDVIEGFLKYALQHGLIDYGSEDAEIEMKGSIDFAWIDRVWKWLDKYRDKNQVNEILNGMFLIPLQESKILRRVYFICSFLMQLDRQTVRKTTTFDL